MDEANDPQEEFPEEENGLLMALVGMKDSVIARDTYVPNRWIRYVRVSGY